MLRAQYQRTILLLLYANMHVVYPTGMFCLETKNQGYSDIKSTREHLSCLITNIHLQSIDFI